MVYEVCYNPNRYLSYIFNQMFRSYVRIIVCEIINLPTRATRDCCNIWSIILAIMQKDKRYTTEGLYRNIPRYYVYIYIYVCMCFMINCRRNVVTVIKASN